MVIRRLFLHQSLSLLGLRAFLLAILSIWLMVFDHRENSFVHIHIHPFLSTIVTPIQYIVDFPIRMTSDTGANFSSKRKLIEENTTLKAEQLVSSVELQKLAALETENATLRNLIQGIKPEQRFLVAKVLIVDSDPFVGLIVIDQGNDKDIFVGQPVFDKTGVMGQVIQVGKFSSQVLLITDNRSGIPVQVLRNGQRGIALGEGNRSDLSIEYFSNTSDIKIGDQLISSGLDGHFPAGYPVAIVTKVNSTPGASFLKIEAKPTANINGSTLVLLTWPEKAIEGIEHDRTQ